MAVDLTRRGFLAGACAGAGCGAARAGTERASPGLALLGGRPVRTAPFPSWPVVGDEDRKAWREVLASGRWNRLGGGRVAQFETAWAAALGARHCLATASGTSALYTALAALDVGPGDEVIVPVYTFVATINVVLLHHALPVLIDTDRRTMQIDAAKVEAAITPRTRCILPVHIGGSAADLDVILELGARRGIPVLEDACQAHLGEWRGRKLGTLGRAGCFSFQASKNLNAGEGGALVSADESLAEVARSFHNQGRAPAGRAFSYARNGDNRRLTEFQGALLLTQLARLEAQTRTREENAAYLSERLREIPGLEPARTHAGCTRNAYHLYMFRYDAERFAGLDRDTALKAVRAEGVPCSGGYAPLDREPLWDDILASRGFRRIYGERALREFRERVRCPENDRLCREAVWLTQDLLLGSRADMDQIAEAWRKVQRDASRLARL